MSPIQSEETIKLLTGQSGCEVALCRRGGFYFVRKTSASPDYNPRLIRQIGKQVWLGKVIAVPTVLDQGVKGDLAFYEMEYIAGHDFGTYCTHEKLSAIYGLADNINLVFTLFSETANGVIEQEKFLAKIRSVKQAIRTHPLYREHGRALDELCGRMEQADWSAIPKTECHGDFTLENIIFQVNGELVFLDLLDGDLESFWMDIAKCLQDLESGWSLRRLLWVPAPTQEGRFLGMVSRYLAEELSQRVAASFPGAYARLAQLRTLQAMRVLPYVRETGVFARIVENLKSLNRIE